MRLIFEARLEGAAAAEATIVDVVERRDRGVADLGLTLAEGRALLVKVQSIPVSQQTAGWLASQVVCCRCGSALAHKDSRSIVMRTVFGKVEVSSPGLLACSCAGKREPGIDDFASLHGTLTPTNLRVRAKSRGRGCRSKVGGIPVIRESRRRRE